MSKVYYCYTCSEYFKVKNSDIKNNSDAILCPLCAGDDTEHSPEEEKDQDIDDSLNNYESELKYNNSLDDGYDLEDEEDEF